MTPKNWITLQHEDIQMEFWKGLSHFLNNYELQNVMGGVANGRNIMLCHEGIGAFEKYQLEVFKLIQTLSHKYPESVINPIL